MRVWFRPTSARIISMIPRSVMPFSSTLRRFASWFPTGPGQHGWGMHDNWPRIDSAATPCPDCCCLLRSEFVMNLGHWISLCNWECATGSGTSIVWVSGLAAHCLRTVVIAAAVIVVVCLLLQSFGSFNLLKVFFPVLNCLLMQLEPAIAFYQTTTRFAVSLQTYIYWWAISGCITPKPPDGRPNLTTGWESSIQFNY